LSDSDFLPKLLLLPLPKERLQYHLNCFCLYFGENQSNKALMLDRTKMRTKFDDSGIQVKEELIEEDDCEQQTTSKRQRSDDFDSEDDDDIARGSLPPARKRIKRELNNELNDDEPKNNESDRKSRKAPLINEKLIKSSDIFELTLLQSFDAF
uniref:BESS domain-containing protein n=1 Tax=Anisakis simplex TaxID=6269 RepID=A0A0M3J7J1_ANISI